MSSGWHCRGRFTPWADVLLNLLAVEFVSPISYSELRLALLGRFTPWADVLLALLAVEFVSPISYSELRSALPWTIHPLG